MTEIIDSNVLQASVSFQTTRADTFESIDIVLPNVTSNFTSDHALIGATANVTLGGQLIDAVLVQSVSGAQVARLSFLSDIGTCVVQVSFQYFTQ